MKSYPLDVGFRLLENKRTIKAIENGEDNWKEILDTTDKVRCTSPLKGNAYEIIRRRGKLVPLFVGILMAYVLVPKIGRVFWGEDGRMVVETALSENAFAEVMLAAIDTAVSAGLK